MKIFFTSIMLFFSLLSQLKAEENFLRLSEIEKNGRSIGKLFEYYEDKTGNLQIEEVSSIDFKDKFIQSSVDSLSFGFKDSAYWLKLKVENKSAKALQLYRSR